MKQIQFKANAINFHALAEGEGPLVLLLHGFPDTPHTFRHQIAALARAGYRAVAPWLRGYAPTDLAPDGNYEVISLARDAVAMIETLGEDGKDEPVSIVGHDWGASAAYMAALMVPARIRRLSMWAVPHPLQFIMALNQDYDQQRRSFYFFFLQLPVADEAVRADNFAYIERLWRDWSPGFEPPADLLAEVRASLGKPENLAAALGKYRAIYNPALQDPKNAELQNDLAPRTVECPTLALFGQRDGCIGANLSEGMEAFFPAGLERHVLPEAGHFLHVEKPDEVNRLLLAFLER
jgi:pimeloyl-ACP methyl ester carboxylesterase